MTYPYLSLKISTFDASLKEISLNKFFFTWSRLKNIQINQAYKVFSANSF